MGREQREQREQRDQRTGSGERRLRILDAAEREFAAAGYDGARIEAIARGVGVRKAALYYYFPSKAALYGAVVRRLVEHFEARVGPALDAPGRFEDRLDRLLAELDALLAERPTLARIVLHHVIAGPPCEPGAPPAAEPHHLVQRFRLFYEAGCKAGAFRVLDPAQLTASLLGATFLSHATGGRGAPQLGQGGAAAPGRAKEREETTRRLVANGLLTGRSGAKPAD